MLEGTSTWFQLSIVLNAFLIVACFADLAWMYKFRLDSKREKDRRIQNYVIMMRLLTQEMVDDRLRVLAADYRLAADKQSRTLRNPIDEAAINSAARAVDDAKQAFWDVHECARTLGFEVEKSFKAYLPSGPQEVVS